MKMLKQNKMMTALILGLMGVASVSGSAVADEQSREEK